MRTKVTSNPNVRKFAQLLELRLDDMKKITRDVDQRFRRDMNRLYATEGTSGGQKWAPLSDNYRKWKRKVRPGRKILTFDGSLRRSLTRRGAKDHVAEWYLRPQATVVLGTSNRVAEYHARGDGALPKRDVMQTTQRQEQSYLSIARDVMTDKLKRAARVMASWRRGGPASAAGVRRA